MRFVLGVVLVLVAAVASAQTAPAAPAPQTGSLPDGTAYRFDVPANWNGTLLIGLDYAAGRTINPTSAALLARGYAMAGTTRLVTGWEVTQSIANQVATIDLFTRAHRAPARVFVLGSSLGAHTGAATIQARPDRFHGAVLLCGGLAGAIGLWDSKLDALFVARTLLAPTDASLPVIGIPADFATTVRPAWLKMLAGAQQTPEGSARIALAAVIAQLPTWSDPRKPQPAAGNVAAIQEGLYDSLAGGPLPVVGQAMSSRNEIERRSGGNISSNVGVDYADLLRRSGQADLVAALYQQAGLDLRADLEQLAKAPRVTADPQARAWAMPGVWDGNLRMPVITVNGIGDNISPVSGQEAYERAAVNAGTGDLLRQAYTNTAGHCGFSPGETVAAVEALSARVATGRWGDTSPAALNAAAAAVATEPGRFVSYQPAAFMRTFLQASSGASGSAAMSHIRFHVADVPANRAFWIAMGGVPAAKRGDVEVIGFPGLQILLAAAPSAPASEGSVLAHVAFRVKSFAQLEAAGLTVQRRRIEGRESGNVDAPSGDHVEVFEENAEQVRFRLDTPGDASAERHNRPMTAPIVPHHLHWNVPTGADVTAQQFYVSLFGAVPGIRLRYRAADVPGMNFNFSGVATPGAPTRGRTLDRIGIQVRDLGEFTGKLTAAGVRYEQQTEDGRPVVRFTDPWGASIEVTGN